MTHLAIPAVLVLVSCVADDEPGDDTGTATTPTTHDTGTPATTDIPFTVVVEDVQDGAPHCGLEEPGAVQCDAADLVVLWALDSTDFTALFDAHVHLAAPDVDLAGKVAILSYLPLCPSLDSRLRVKAITSSGPALMIDEFLETPDGYGEIVACPYSVVTIPDTIEFTEIEATLRKVWTE